MQISIWSDNQNRSYSSHLRPQSSAFSQGNFQSSSVYTTFLTSDFVGGHSKRSTENAYKANRNKRGIATKSETEWKKFEVSLEYNPDIDKPCVFNFLFGLFLLVGLGIFPLNFFFLLLFLVFLFLGRRLDSVWATFFLACKINNWFAKAA